MSKAFAVEVNSRTQRPSMFAEKEKKTDIELHTILNLNLLNKQ